MPGNDTNGRFRTRGNVTTGRHPEISFTISLPQRFGKLLVSYRNGRLTRLQFLGREGENDRRRSPAARQGRDKSLEEKLRADFLAYFAGKKVEFDYPLDVGGYTQFERAVWGAMSEIPYGETRSYRWLAQRIGKPRACRAVGNACGKNPLPIVQPCHRVVGSNGRLGGFSGGLDLKRHLLRLEGVEVK